MTEPTNAQLIATIGSHLQGYIRAIEKDGQGNIAPLLVNEFNGIINLLKARLPEDKAPSNSG